MATHKQTRRGFLKTAAGTASLGAGVPYFFTGEKVIADEAKVDSKNDRLHVGAIGCGNQGFDIAKQAGRLGEMVAVCDVDSQRAAAARNKLSDGKADVYSDYRKVLERKDIDVVTIGTPDHWHTKIAIEAMQADKDVYCEKPLTLTIDEGKLITRTVKKTGRVFQVGTQQRSEYGGKFLTAVALCHAGRLGKLQRITCAIGDGDTGGPFEASNPPPHLDWETWLGQTPKVPYVKQRCHFKFRWWYEYSGGQLTDWGVHHADISHWIMDASNTGPISIEGTAKHQNIPKGFTTAYQFDIKYKFANGVELNIVDSTPEFRNGIFIEGTQGRLFVNRGKLTGKPVEQLQENPLPEDAITKLYKGKKPGSHMGNFFECVKTREQPISDVFTHHRSVSTCHLAVICVRTGRPLKWDPRKEQIIGDEQANAMLRRQQRKGYEIRV